jgi:hypothetical protein
MTLNFASFTALAVERMVALSVKTFAAEAAIVSDEEGVNS